MRSERVPTIPNEVPMSGQRLIGSNGSARPAAERHTSEADSKQAKKAAKRLHRLEKDQKRQLDSWEQYRALWDGLDFKRQIVNMGDKKVRFALVIMGVLNASVLIVLTRGPVLHAIPDGARLWLVLFLATYCVASFGFIVQVIEALRPKPGARDADREQWRSFEGAPGSPRRERPQVSLLIRGPQASLSFEEERKRWSLARLSELNAELIVLNRSVSRLLDRQLVSVTKVYQGLKVLTVLAALILTLLLGGALLQGGGPPDPGPVASAAPGASALW